MRDKKEEFLDIKLEAYAKSDYYPFHMPGHKRNPIAIPNPYTIDITEIDGFDNLHSSKEILKEAQQRAAVLYGAKKSYYLINGSTCGILAAISAAVKPHGTLLMARNVHKSVYHAAYLRGLITEYLNVLLPNTSSEMVFPSVVLNNDFTFLSQITDTLSFSMIDPPVSSYSPT